MLKHPARRNVKAVRRLTDLTPDPHNANPGTDRGRAALQRSLREYGRRSEAHCAEPHAPRRRDMSRHRYKVLSTLPWIDGGHPGPHFTWIGGTPVVYKPGAIVTIDDREVRGIAHALEATDDGGRKVLKHAQAMAAAPAKQTMLAEFIPKDRAWFARATDEKLRAQKRIRELVDRMLAHEDEPSIDDVVGALRDGYPPSKALIKYVVRVLTSPRTPGPKNPRRSTYQDLAIKAYYTYELDQAKRAYEVNNRRSRVFADIAKQATMQAFRLGKRTVERVVALRASRKSNR